MTSDAANLIRSQLSCPAPGEELALITVFRQSEVVGDTEHIWFEGEHYMLCTYKIGQRPQAVQIDLFGHPVSIIPSTLASLKGRTLTVRRVIEHRGARRKIERHVLVSG